MPCGCSLAQTHCQNLARGKRIKVLDAISVNKIGKPGEVLDDKLTISCKKNSIKILKLQKEGKSSMVTEDFLLGNKIKKGEILG